MMGPHWLVHVPLHKLRVPPQKVSNLNSFSVLATCTAGNHQKNLFEFALNI